MRQFCLTASALATTIFQVEHGYYPACRRSALRIRLSPSSSSRVGAGLDAAVEVGEGELLVGAVQVVVVLAPAQEQRIDAQLLLDQPDDRDRAPLADEDRLGAEARLDGADRGPDARAYRC